MLTTPLSTLKKTRNLNKPGQEPSLGLRSMLVDASSFQQHQPHDGGKDPRKEVRDGVPVGLRLTRLSDRTCTPETPLEPQGGWVGLKLFGQAVSA